MGESKSAAPIQKANTPLVNQAAGRVSFALSAAMSPPPDAKRRCISHQGHPASPPPDQRLQHLQNDPLSNTLTRPLVTSPLVQWRTVYDELLGAGRSTARLSYLYHSSVCFTLSFPWLTALHPYTKASLFGLMISFFNHHEWQCPQGDAWFSFSELLTTMLRYRSDTLVSSPFLEPLDMSGLSLDGVAWQGLLCHYTLMTGVSLVGAQLNGMSLQHVRLDDADLTNASMVGVRVKGVSFFRTRLDGVVTTHMQTLNTLFHAALRRLEGHWMMRDAFLKRYFDVIPTVTDGSHRYQIMVDDLLSLWNMATVSLPYVQGLFAEDTVSPTSFLLH